MTTKKVLITGSTGQQGSAVINALIAQNSPFQILALTRNASSPTAVALAARPNITVVEGDPAKPAPIFTKHAPIHSVFSVTALGSRPGDEEPQALPLIDASIKQGVQHFVFSSVDRGGVGRSDENPTEILHFEVKHRIEKYLREKAKGTSMQWTILRPTCFMENLQPKFLGGGFPSLWAGLGDKPLQLISCHDIGVFAARALTNPSKYSGKEVSLAGDELTYSQGRQIFKDTMGYEMAGDYAFARLGVRYFLPEIAIMFKWFKDEGYGADVKALRKEEPALQDWAAWLRDSSPFERKM